MWRELVIDGSALPTVEVCLRAHRTGLAAGGDKPGGLVVDYLGLLASASSGDLEALSDVEERLTKEIARSNE